MVCDVVTKYLKLTANNVENFPYLKKKNGYDSEKRIMNDEKNVRIFVVFSNAVENTCCTGLPPLVG